MELKEYAWGFLVVALFMICIFSFVFQFTAANTEIQGLDTSGIDITGLGQKLNNSQAEAEGWLASFASENPLVSFGSLILFSVVGIAKLVINSIIGFFNIIIGGITYALGIPPIVIGVVSAMLLIGLIFAGWSAIKTGK